MEDLLKPENMSILQFYTELFINYRKLKLVSRDEDPDPVGSGDFRPAGSGTFLNGSGSGSYL